MRPDWWCPVWGGRERAGHRSGRGCRSLRRAAECTACGSVTAAYGSVTATLTLSLLVLGTGAEVDYLEQFGSSSVSTCTVMAVFSKVGFSKGGSF